MNSSSPDCPQQENCAPCHLAQWTLRPITARPLIALTMNAVSMKVRPKRTLRPITAHPLATPPMNIHCAPWQLVPWLPAFRTLCLVKTSLTAHPMNSAQWQLTPWLLAHEQLVPWTLCPMETRALNTALWQVVRSTYCLRHEHFPSRQFHPKHVNG